MWFEFQGHCSSFHQQILVILNVLGIKLGTGGTGNHDMVFAFEEAVSEIWALREDLDT